MKSRITFKDLKILKQLVVYDPTVNGEKKDRKNKPSMQYLFHKSLYSGQWITGYKFYIKRV